MQLDLPEIIRLDQVPPSSSETAGLLNTPSPLSLGQYDCQSQLRLSLSLDGKAEVVYEEHSPSPRFPCSMGSGAGPLSYSRPHSPYCVNSTRTGVNFPPISATTSSPPLAPSRRKSRNVHAWELCCDSDKQDKLTIQAEDESSGSAIAAINLLRSTSATLYPGSMERNISPMKRLCQDWAFNKSYPGDNLSNGPTSPKMHRHRSAPFMQTLEAKYCSRPMSKTISDKENWNPRPVISRLPQTKYQGQSNIMLILERKTSLSRSARRQIDDVEGISPQHADIGHKTSPLVHDQVSARAVLQDTSMANNTLKDKDVERFVGGDSSQGKGRDMDCIAGLLSLRQGNWR